MTDIAMGPDLAAIKQRQQATWASGDYHMIGTQIQIVSELLIEALDVHATERLLDVATGSGNAALAGARRGLTVVGIDYVPALLDRARRRRDAEGLDAEFIEGDAEALPFSDGQFDVVSKTPMVAGDAWSDFLPVSQDTEADWVTLKCGNYNTVVGYPYPWSFTVTGDYTFKDNSIDPGVGIYDLNNNFNCYHEYQYDNLQCTATNTTVFTNTGCTNHVHAWGLLYVIEYTNEQYGHDNYLAFWIDIDNCTTFY